MSRSANLMRLQTIDTRIQIILNRIEEIENILNDDKELIQSENQMKDSENLLVESQKALHQSEFDVKDQQLKIEQTENSLYGGKIRNPKELQDLQHEAAALKRYLTVLEDRQIESMISLEEAETNHKLASIKFEEIQTNKNQQNNNLTFERSRLDLDLKHLYTEREVAIQTINGDDLDLYEKLRTNRRGLAVSKIIDHTCSACGSSLSPAVRQSAQSPTQIIQCPSCRRILYLG
jgi:hypothetical protein